MLSGGRRNVQDATLSMTQQFFQSVVKNKEKNIDANFELICVSMDIFKKTAAQKCSSYY